MQSHYEGFEFNPNPTQYVGLCLEYPADWSICISQPTTPKPDGRGNVVRLPMPPLRYKPNGPVTQSPDPDIKGSGDWVAGPLGLCLSGRMTRKVLETTVTHWFPFSYSSCCDLDQE